MKVLLIIAAILVAGLASGYEYINVRNELADQRNAIRASWAAVEDAIDKRAELAPGVVAVIERRTKTGIEVIQQLNEARAALAAARTPQEKIQANAKLDAALTRLLDQAQGDTRWKKDRQWRNLLDELATAKNRIAEERQKYNDAVKQYNTNIQLFPKNVVAALAGFAREDAYFKTEQGAPRRPR
jgi:LemA protein